LYSESSRNVKFGEMALIRGVIKIIKRSALDFLASTEEALSFFGRLVKTADCKDLMQLMDMVNQMQYLMQQAHRCRCLSDILTMKWNYCELMLFLNNYRCMLNLYGFTIAGEQMHQYVKSAQGGKISRNHLN